MQCDQPIPISHTQGSRGVSGAHHKLLVHSIKWNLPRILYLMRTVQEERTAGVISNLTEVWNGRQYRSLVRAWRKNVAMVEQRDRWSGCNWHSGVRTPAVLAQSDCRLHVLLEPCHILSSLCIFIFIWLENYCTHHKGFRPIWTSYHLLQNSTKSYNAVSKKMYSFWNEMKWSADVGLIMVY
jgi:hypothetical protein